MTDPRQYQVTHSQRSLLAIMRALEDAAAREQAAGDLRASLMNGVLQDDPADSAP